MRRCLILVAAIALTLGTCATALRYAVVRGVDDGFETFRQERSR